MAKRIYTYKELNVYNSAFRAAMDIFQNTRGFPDYEKYSLVDQMMRSSRSVCSNIAEAWRKRRYKAAFISKLNDAESEACETQVWLQFAEECGYLDKETTSKLDEIYEKIQRQLICMINNAEKWLIKNKTP